MQRTNKTTLLTSAALLTALGIVLGFFKIPINQFIELRFGIIPIALAGMIFGPITGMLVGMCSDIGQYFVRPTGPFFPGFTVSAAVTGLIFGLILYKKGLSVAGLLLSLVIHAIVVGLLLNTLWLSMLYGTPYQVILAPRALKQVIMIPVNCLMLFLIMKPISMTSIVKRMTGRSGAMG